MYPDAFTIERLAKDLNDLLKNRCLLNLFSTSKTELYFGFDIAIGLKIEFFKGQAFFRFPIGDYFPKNNRLKKFSTLEHQKISTVNAHPNSRSFDIEFVNGHKLVFKLFGQYSNVIHYGSKATDIFCLDYPKDLLIPIENFTQPHLTPNQTFNNAIALINANPKSDAFITLDTIKHNLSGNESIHYEAFKKQYLNQNIHILKSETGEFQLSCFPDHSPYATFPTMIDALSSFSSLYIQNETFTFEKTKTLRETEQALHQKTLRMKTIENRIEVLSHGDTHRQIGDIILANQSTIVEGASGVELYDFYNQKHIKIHLNSELTPQQNASVYYQMAKSNAKELNHKQNEWIRIKTDIEVLRESYVSMENIETIKDLKSSAAEKHDVKKKIKEALPYRAYKLDEYNILVGKNAKSNDELLSKFSSKNDVWLHAKDVSGSHVILKNKAGALVPLAIIEQAAALAAWHSKAKNQSLAAVVYTFRKYVRKSKGMAPGQVIVERETGLLVKPKDFDKD